MDVFISCYVLTQWCRVLLEKLTGSQLLKKFHAFCGTRKFITAVTTARHLYLSWARSIQFMPHPSSWRSILILFSHLRLGLSSGSFPQVSPPNTFMLLSPPPYVLHVRVRPFHSSRFDHPNNIWWGVQIIKHLIMQFYPLCCYFVPIRTKYSPQHPILKHHQPTLLPHCGWPSLTPIKNKRQNYSSVYLDLYVFG